MFGSAMLDERGVRPGMMAAGHVHLGGAREGLAVDGVTVTLMTVVSGVEVDFLRCQVSAGFNLGGGSEPVDSVRAAHAVGDAVHASRGRAPAGGLGAAADHGRPSRGSRATSG